MRSIVVPLGPTDDVLSFPLEYAAEGILVLVRWTRVLAINGDFREQEGCAILSAVLLARMQYACAIVMSFVVMCSRVR